MQEIRSSNPPVVTGICDSNKSRARHHRRLNRYMQRSHFLHSQTNSVPDLGRVVFLVKHTKNSTPPN